jgi:Na+-transporting NADH:ubiquinone oxidoreductase subunit NqrC
VEAVAEVIMLLMQILVVQVVVADRKQKQGLILDKQHKVLAVAGLAMGFREAGEALETVCTEVVVVAVLVVQASPAIIGTLNPV